MSFSRISLLALASFAACAAQAQAAPLGNDLLAPQTIVPITFVKGVSANRAKPGDAVLARTTQAVRLSDGQELKSGAEVLGHVVNVQSAVVDKTPYAKRAVSVLAIQFDTLSAHNEKIPLHVTVRALADVFATSAAVEPRPSDEDPLHRTTQIGGDIVTPSQSEIVNGVGDTVGHNKKGGNFARLIANVGTGNLRCDSSSTEQPVSVFSASACGMYGFSGMSFSIPDAGLSSSGFALSSGHRAAEIPRYSSALLEVLPDSTGSSSSR
ncbi:MAG: hypothetical protein ACRYFU_26455 [Janthinobacterium lividum]